MAKVTRIEQQKKRSEQYSVFIDNQYSFALSANDLITADLHIGEDLTEKELELLQKSSLASKAYDQALTYISMRMRSEYEVINYLERKGYSQYAIEGVKQRLKDNGLLNDMEFARAWIADRNKLKPRSRAVLRQELRQKGIETELVDRVLADSAPDDELENAIRVAQKKLTRYPDQPKLIAYLVHQGFSYSVVKQALDQISASD